MDLNHISEILRMLQPRQEKVIRLYFGLGCQRCAFGTGDRRGVRSFFPGDRRYPGCRGEEAGAPRIDSYPNARSRAAGSRTPLPVPRAVVAGIQAEVLVRSPRASLVLIRWRSGCGDPLWIPGAFPFRTAQPGELSIQQVDGFGGGLLRQRGRRHSLRQCRDEGAAGALVAGVGPAAAGAQLAQLLW